MNLREQIAKIVRSYEERSDINISGEDFVVEFDPLHLYQILTNLIQNAIDAAGIAKPLQLKLDNVHQTLEIIDQGPGIENEVLKKIFEPYFTSKKKGIGLGLALVKKLISINNCRIEVYSELGKGTSFVIYFRKINYSYPEEYNDAPNGN